MAHPITDSQSAPRLPWFWLLLVGGLGWLLALSAGCAPQPTPTARPSPTPTPVVALPKNQNVDTLNAAKSSLGAFEFGFASLLEKDETKVIIENHPDGEIARLAYPKQPAEPAEWPAVDSFVLSYAVQKFLLQSPNVLNTVLGRFGLASPLGDLHEHVDHVAVWVRFSDGSQAVVDFSPLASSYGSLHTATELLTEPGQVESQFTEWRQGVPLNLLQPLKIVQQKNNVYYILGHVKVSQDRYTFSLRVYLTQTATPIRPLNLTRGVMAQVEIKRSDYEALRKLLLSDGPDSFTQHPELLTRSGDQDPAIQKILDEQLPLLWRLVTKLEPPKAVLPTSTPVPTATPTPTATPPALPQETS